MARVTNVRDHLAQMARLLARDPRNDLRDRIEHQLIATWNDALDTAAHSPHRITDFKIATDSVDAG